jgi:hypothetical protein
MLKSAFASLGMEVKSIVQREGVRIVRKDVRGPAHMAGLMVDDVVTAIDGKSLRNISTFEREDSFSFSLCFLDCVTLQFWLFLRMEISLSRLCLSLALQALTLPLLPLPPQARWTSASRTRP